MEFLPNVSLLRQHHLAEELLPLLAGKGVTVPGGPKLQDGGYLLVAESVCLRERCESPPCKQKCDINICW